jgi:hypothetical protein
MVIGLHKPLELRIEVGGNAGKVLDERPGSPE